MTTILALVCAWIAGVAFGRWSNTWSDTTPPAAKPRRLNRLIILGPHRHTAVQWAGSDSRQTLTTLTRLAVRGDITFYDLTRAEDALAAPH